MTTREKMDRYREKAAKEMENLDMRVKEFHAKADKVASSARVEYYQQLSKLQAKLDAANQWYDKVKEAGEEDWNEVKEGMDDAIGLVKKKLDDFDVANMPT